MTSASSDRLGALRPAIATSGGPGRNSELVMSKDDFDAIRAFVHKAFGIALSPAKMPLVKMRLRNIVQSRGLASAREYVSKVLSSPSAEAVSELADAITTNHTFFWRENAHFELLERRLLQEHKDKNKSVIKPSLRIWCAAASTGQEPYTMAAAVRIALGPDLRRWDTGLLATDLSARALAEARVGFYTNAEAAPLPDLYRRTMFEDVEGGVRVRDDLREDVTYRRLNLLTPFRFKQQFDIVFCRNVMIYFDDPTKLDLAARIAAVIRPGGYLVVGLSESLGTAPVGLKTIAPAVYQKPVGPP